MINNKSKITNQISKIKKAANDAKKNKDVVKKLDCISEALIAYADLEAQKLD